MKVLLALLLALCAVLSVHCEEVPCDASNCVCDLTKYSESLTPPNATVECLSGQMNIYISKCQLEKNRYNSANPALSNNTGNECNSLEVSVNNEPQVAFHNPLSLGKCGNQIEFNSTHVIISNTLNIYAASSNIITRNNASLAVSCIYPLNFTVQLNTTINAQDSTAQITVPGVLGTLPIVMALYTDETFSQAYTVGSTPLTVESFVYVGISIPSLEANTFSVKVLSLYASAQNTGGEIYNLTTGSNGCPDSSYGDELLSVINNGNGSEARYKLKVFKIANSDLVYLSADVTICSSVCVPQCGAVLSRTSDTISSSQDVATLRIEIDASQYNYLDSGATDRFSKTMASFFLILSLLFVKLM